MGGIEEVEEGGEGEGPGAGLEGIHHIFVSLGGELVRCVGGGVKVEAVGCGIAVCENERGRWDRGAINEGNKRRGGERISWWKRREGNSRVTVGGKKRRGGQIYGSMARM